MLGFWFIAIFICGAFEGVCCRMSHHQASRLYVLMEVGPDLSISVTGLNAVDTFEACSL